MKIKCVPGASPDARLLKVGNSPIYGIYRRQRTHSAKLEGLPGINPLKMDGLLGWLLSQGVLGLVTSHGKPKSVVDSSVAV
jgi:hypothetical protein